MKKDTTPQDNIQTLGGYKKLLYVTDSQGNYQSVQSSGWEVEEYANTTAVNEFHRLATQAHQQAILGKKSPLEFHMYHKRMDLALLSQVTGLFQWRIKRHMKPQLFKQLKPTMLQRYSEALGISVAELQHLPEQFQ